MRSGPNPGILTTCPTPAVRLLTFSLLASLAVACASHAPRVPGPLRPVGQELRVRHPAAPRTLPRPARRSSRLGSKVADAAIYYLDHAPRGFRADCSGFVCASFERAGVDLGGTTRSLWDTGKAAGAIHKRKKPTPGDLAFFDNTYDRNKNGRLDDSLSHIAVVIEVRTDGTILLAHGGTGRGRATLTMNLHHPSETTARDGESINDWLRRKRADDPPSTRYLAGELWRGFASPTAFE